MKTVILMILASTFLASCGKSQQEIEAENAKKSAAEAAAKLAAERAAFEEKAKPYIALLKEQLKDADSAQFRNLRFGHDKQYGSALCGEVNAKNSYGGYTGYYPFAVSDSPLNRGSKVVIIDPNVRATEGLLNEVYFTQAGCAKKTDSGSVDAVSKPKDAPQDSFSK